MEPDHQDQQPPTATAMSYLLDAEEYKLAAQCALTKARAYFSRATTARTNKDKIRLLRLSRNWLKRVNTAYDKAQESLTIAKGMVENK